MQCIDTLPNIVLKKKTMKRVQTLFMAHLLPSVLSSVKPQVSREQLGSFVAIVLMAVLG